MANKWNLLMVLALAATPITALAQTDGSTTTTASGDDAAADGSTATTTADDGATVEPSSDDAADAAAVEESTTASTEGAAALGSAEACPDGEERDADGNCVAIDRARSEEEAEAAQAASEPLAWRNSFFSWTMGSTFNTFYRGADLSYNPLYYWTFFLTPRWYLSSNVFFVVNQGLYYELTDDDAATYNHEPQLYDTTIELRATFPVADGRLILIPSVRLTIPVSKLSQAAQRYFNTGLGLTTVVNLPEVANGNLAIALSYRRWWGSSVTPLAMGGALGDVITSGETINGSRANNDFGDSIPSDGGTLGVDRLLAGLSWNLTPVEGLTVTLSGFLIWDQGYAVTEVPLGIMGRNDLVLEANGNNWRMFSSYSAQIAYDVAPWFNLGIGVSNATNLSPFLAPDGSVLSPFNPNTQVYLSGTVTLDGIYETLTAGGEDDGLTPEERQRRRQGLAALDEEALGEDSGADEEDEDETGAPRATGAF